MYIYFDFDGTIADSLALGLEISDFLAEKYNFKKIDRSKINYYKTLTAKELFKDLKIPIYKLPILAPVFKLEINRRIEQLVIFEGMESVLKKLSENHFLGILTSNSVENVKKFLEKYKLLHIFSDIKSELQLFGKHLSLNKIIRQNKIEKENFIYVGDEVRDIEAAKKTGIKIISVTWGFNLSTTLKKYSPNFLAEKPSDILKFVENK